MDVGRDQLAQQKTTCCGQIEIEANNVLLSALFNVEKRYCYNMIVSASLK